MALPLESTIMQEIGLGNSYHWFNGSGSCAYIRRQAATQLPQAIQEHHNAGDEIVAPIRSLLALVTECAAHHEEDQYVLTKTWEAASYVIAEHIHQYHVTDANERTERINRLVSYLRQHHVPYTIDRRHWRPAWQEGF